jgi:hypothetical protein
MGSFANEEIAVLRSGKAKKTDPPIPADLAPISGGSSRRRLQKDLDADAPALESIRLRYSEESIAEEVPAETPQAEQDTAKSGGKNRRNRRGRGKKPENAEAKAQNKPKAENPNPPKAAEGAAAEGAKPEGEGKKKPRRNFRRRRPKAPKAEQ